MGPADSDRITRVPPYSGILKENQIFRLQDCHLLRFSFPTNSAIFDFCDSYIKILQPQINLVWAIPFSLATTKRIDCFLSFPPVTKMFQFTGLLII